MADPIDTLEGGLCLLSAAIGERDPYHELKLRMADIAKDFDAVKAEIERIKTEANRQIDTHAEELSGVHRAWRAAQAENERLRKACEQALAWMQSSATMAAAEGALKDALRTV